MDIDLPRLALYTLATFRIAELLVIDEGPFEIFMSLRGWFYRPNERGLRHTIGEALTCVHCTGIWVAFFLTFTLPYKSLLEFIIYFLSIAGLQSLLAGNLGRSK